MYFDTIILGEIMKNIIKIAICILIVIVIYIYKDSITSFISDEIIYKGSNKVLNYNEYYINNDYMYVQNIDSNSVSDRQEVLNMIYSIINSGDNSFSFKCNYTGCVDDVKKIISSNEIVSSINNFVHPYNSFSNITFDVSEIGKVTIMPTKIYTDEEINAVNKYISDFINSYINDNMSNYDKVKVFHDYIIENTIYDDSGNKDSFTAYSLITTGKSICSGYSDIIAIYLNTLGIKNYKITSLNHVWNLVYLDGKWLHVDATWDDPVASDGNQYLLDNFLLIDTTKLLELDTVEHTFDRNIYMEANC